MRRPSARVVGLTVVLLLAVTTAVTVGSAELGPLPAGAAVEPPGLIVQRDHLTGLDHPWDVGFLPDGTMFVTERPGRLKVRLPNGTVNLVAAPGDVRLGSEGGMLGLAVDPLFATNRFVYTCLSSNLGAPDNRIVRWTVDPTFTGTTARADIVTGLPYSTGRHSGCRPRFGPDNALWIGTGDAAVGTNPQSPTSLGGKVLRVDRNGAAAVGNPDLGVGSDRRVYTFGHRNLQGLAFRPGTGAAYSVEHGTGRDDEVNLLVAGGNYGWDPVPGYDESRPMTDFVKFPTARGAAWSSGYPTIAPSGATFLTGAQWKGWDGALAVAVLKNTELRVMFLDGPGTTVTSAVVPVQLDLGVRLRSAVQGPDGSLYLATDETAGAVWKVTPFGRAHRERRVRTRTG
ncbi:MAG: PQQ-dependent sugar dehydrogenase [Acidimicrobiia bacterium]